MFYLFDQKENIKISDICIRMILSSSVVLFFRFYISSLQVFNLSYMVKVFFSMCIHLFIRILLIKYNKEEAIFQTVKRLSNFWSWRNNLHSYSVRYYKTNQGNKIRKHMSIETDVLITSLVPFIGYLCVSCWNTTFLMDLLSGNHMLSHFQSNKI